MARQARGEVIDPRQVQVAHCVQRCVRRAKLCGHDPVSGSSFEHRREWIRERLEFLASVFAIDCLTYSVMSNHVHQVLRSRPDVVDSWSDRDVACRWLRLCPQRREADGTPSEPTEQEIATLVAQPEVLAERRRRLSDISWWMRFYAEHISRRCNREDEVTGHFWEARYKSQLLLDEAAVLACAAYVDLNPIRAAMAETPEASEFTGANDRIDDLFEREPNADGEPTVPMASADGEKDLHERERAGTGRRSGWLSPIEIDEPEDPSGVDAELSGRRASRKGFLAVSLRQYLELLDWTGRQLRLGKVGRIPEHLAPILIRLGVTESEWCKLVRGFRDHFRRAVGTREHLVEEAARRGQRWMQAPGNPLTAVAA